jgi:hypothetical protein
MDSSALSSQDSETSTSPEATGGEARLPEKQNMVRFEFATPTYIPDQYNYVPLKIDMEKLPGTVIAQCLEDCGGTPADLGTITVPGNIGVPDEKELLACLHRWKLYLDNPRGGKFVATTHDKSTSLFLDFLGINALYVPPVSGWYRAQSMSYACDASYASCDLYSSYDDNEWEDDKPRRATKRRIQEKRQQQGNYDPCADDYEEDYEEDEMYAEWIESLNIEEQDFTL